MADWKTVQQQVNATADAKLHECINGAVNFDQFNLNIRVSLPGGLVMQLDDLRDSIRKAIFIEKRDEWRTKQAEEVVKTVAQ